MDGELELATWVLAGFTGVLAIATLVYAYLTWQTGRQIGKALKLLERVVNVLQNATENLEEVGEYIRDATQNLEDVVGHVDEATDNLKTVGEHLSSLADTLDEIRSDQRWEKLWK
jgi:methyl-accepting chemotaxis protein